jgi:anti-sigma regulatory factor (Ser/Thr protein kinase)
MTDSWPLRSSLELGALPTAVPCACLHVRHVLWEWGLSSLSDRAELLVHELVANAVDAAAGRDGQVVSLHLSGHATQVLIEVRDPCGHVVRRELTADPRPAILPRRIPCARPKPRAEIVTDLDILRRLRDNLKN